MSVTKWARIHRKKKADKKARKSQKISPRGAATHASRVRSLLPHETRSYTKSELLAPVQLGDDLVAVSVPTWRTPRSFLLRAVGSILQGSHGNVRVVVISDGEKRPSWHVLPDKMREDPRVLCVSSSRNLGPYFLHDIVLRGVKAPFFAVQDSDDDSHLRRLELQLAALHTHAAEAIHSPIIQVSEYGKQTRCSGSTEAHPMFTHNVQHFGLYSTPTLMALGGYYAGHRVGYDTCISGFLNLLARTFLTKQALYTRYSHGRSLTRAKGTGHGSPLRREHWSRLAAMWNKAYECSRISRRHAARWIAGEARKGARIHGDVGLRDALIAQIREQMTERPFEPPALGTAHLLRVLRCSPGNPSAPSADCIVDLYRFCERTRPKVVLDVGSGLSTLALGLYGARYGARVISLEHSRKWQKVTKTALRDAGLEGHVQLEYAPLRDGPHGTQYSHRLRGILQGDVPEFVFVDGPPENKNGDRAAILDDIGLVHGNLDVWLHDGNRKREGAAVSRWRQRFNVRSAQLDSSRDKRGVWKLKITK